MTTAAEPATGEARLERLASASGLTAEQLNAKLTAVIAEGGPIGASQRATLRAVFASTDQPPVEHRKTA